MKIYDIRPDVVVTESQSVATMSDIERPAGISDEEWTDDYQNHLRWVKQNDPKLYRQILSME